MNFPIDYLRSVQESIAYYERKKREAIAAEQSFALRVYMNTIKTDKSFSVRFQSFEAYFEYYKQNKFPEYKAYTKILKRLKKEERELIIDAAEYED